MNKTLKGVFLILAIIFLGYGIYILNPTKNYDNTNSYMSIALGLISLILSLIKEKEKNK